VKIKTKPNEVRSIKIEDYTYELPEDKIAKYPLEQRDSSKLLVYKNYSLSEDIYKNISAHLPERTLLVFNNTKVIQARIQFLNAKGQRIEIFCLEPAGITEPNEAMQQRESSRWKCLVGRANKWKEPQLEINNNGVQLRAEVLSKQGDHFIIHFQWEPTILSFAEVLETVGEIPIPPYLNRASESIDQDRYQTLYSKEKGSIAAPTAGLHFTQNVFEALQQKNIYTEYVTLHVGAGTFKPVKSEKIQDHVMHSEWIEVNLGTIETLINLQNLGQEKQKVIAIGTTSLRTIETLYWMGVKAYKNERANISELEIRQWDAYELDQDISVRTALSALRDFMNALKMTKLICKTQLLIAPPYQLKICNGLITNFHQPNSTLLLLVAAVVGEHWRSIYDYALENEFRFLSYGDGCLLFN
jgi:S-adenosylmethionine:tRNA ribosyltransferase-isomerase